MSGIFYSDLLTRIDKSIHNNLKFLYTIGKYSLERGINKFLRQL